MLFYGIDGEINEMGEVYCNLDKFHELALIVGMECSTQGV